MSGASLKLGWAYGRLVQLDRTVRAEFDAKIGTEETVEENTKHKLVVVRLLQPLSDDLKELIDVVAHHLRSALDHAVMALARDADEVSKKIQFPVGDTPEDFERELVRRLGKLRPSAIEAVRSSKAYAGGNDWLYGLHHLSIWGKHYDVIPFGSAASHMVISGVVIEGGNTGIIIPRNGRLDEGFVISDRGTSGTITQSDGTPFKPNVTGELRFGDTETHVFFDMSVVPTLARIHREAAILISELAKQLMA